MNEKQKNIVSSLLAFIIVAFLVFAIMHWLAGMDTGEAFNLAISAALGGLLAPHLVKLFNKLNEGR